MGSCQTRANNGWCSLWFAKGNQQDNCFFFSLRGVTLGFSLIFPEMGCCLAKLGRRDLCPQRAGALRLRGARGGAERRAPAGGDGGAGVETARKGLRRVLRWGGGSCWSLFKREQPKESHPFEQCVANLGLLEFFLFGVG